MALPPIDMSAELESDEPTDQEESDEPLEGEPEPDESDGIDPMFAADISEALPDLEDSQIAALQRAFLGLMSSMGGGMSGPPAPPMGA